jgi:hypothetical protein
MLSCWAASYYWKVWFKSGKRLIWKFKVVSHNVLHCFASSIIHAMLCSVCTLPWKLRAQGVSRFALAFFKASACTLATAKLAWSLWLLLLSKNLLLSSCREVSFPRILHVFSGNSTWWPLNYLHGRPFGSTKPFGLFPTLWAAAAVWWLNTPQSCWGPHSTFKHPSEALSQAKERIGSGSRGFGLSGCLAPAPKPQRGKGSKLCNHVQPSIFQSSAEICPANSS